MKKIFVYCIFAALALMGCQVEQEISVYEDPEDTAAGKESKVFTAIIEDEFGGATKTSIDANGNILWKQGDQVSIFAGSTINEMYQVSDASDGKTAASLYQVTSPVFVAGGEIDNNVAFYPYASAAAIVKSENSYVISGLEFPSIQRYSEGSFGDGAFPMAAVTSSSSDMNLKFKNAFGGLKLQLKGTATIAAISITGNSDEILCGAAEVMVSNGSVPSINMTDTSAKTVMLDCGAGVTLNSETATSFIIALPPMTMSGGFTVIVADTENTQMVISTTKSQTINRSSLLKMPAVDYEGTEPATISIPAGNGFIWSEVAQSAIEPLDSYSFNKWFISDGVLYTDSGGKFLTVDNASHTITTTTNTSENYGDVYKNTWTALDGSVYTCFTTNDDSEHDDYYDIYRFENGRWKEVVPGIHYSQFTPNGYYIWKTNNYLYEGSSHRSSNGYTFSTVTMSNLPSNFNTSNVWTSANGNAYYSNGSSHYRFYESSLSWSLLSTSSWPSITAMDVFVVGAITYWVSGGDCYMFNESSRTWTKIDNDFRAGLYGRYVWSYEGKYYYSDGVVTKELKQGGETFTTISNLYFPTSINDYPGHSSNPSICNVHGNMIWDYYFKAPGTCIWNKLSTYAHPIVTLSLSMSDQYYKKNDYWVNDGWDDDVLESYHMYPIDPTSGLCSSDYQTYSPETTFYFAQSLWKDRNGVVHYNDDKRVFNDASGRCYYCCDSDGNTGIYKQATHYRIYDETTNSWSAPIPLNKPINNMYCKYFWSDSDGNIYYTYGYTQYQLVPIE